MSLGEEFQINVTQLTNHYVAILLCYKTHKGTCGVTEPIGVVRIGVDANKKTKQKKATSHDYY